MLVADVSLTGSWEKTLLQIERHTLGPDTFMASITDYTRKATREILNLSLPAAAARTFTCPKCPLRRRVSREYPGNRSADARDAGCRRDRTSRRHRLQRPGNILSRPAGKGVASGPRPITAATKPENGPVLQNPGKQRKNKSSYTVSRIAPGNGAADVCRSPGPIVVTGD